MIAPDLNLGIDEYVHGKEVLNVGCGSQVDAIHLEYDLNKIKVFHGIDISLNFITKASELYVSDDFQFSVASVEKLPYIDGCFDAVIIPFTLHHLKLPFDEIIREAFRVSRKYVIVFDHVKAPKDTLLGFLQQSYWNIFDGGYQYLRLSEWEFLLKNYKVIKKLQTGSLGRHVFKFIIEKNINA
jgi:ubiquinone/menaquinone biosynthesis C-methylase UbiE